MSVALVTGAGGQDGRLLSRVLLARGCRVVGLVRRADAPLTPGVERLVCDAGDGAALTEALGRAAPDWIFHLAAAHHSSEGGGPDAAAVERAMVRVNFEAAEAILAWMGARKPGARAVFAGSSQMYPAPDGGADRRIDERAPVAPRTFYGRTKAWTRDLARDARARRGLHAGFAVLFNHESALRGAGYVTRKIVDAAATGGTADIMDAGARADWSAAEDVVAAMAAMAAAPEPADYVLGSGAAHAVRDWIDIAFARAGADPGALRIARETRGPALIAEPARAAKAGIWRPRVGFRALVEGMTDAAIREFRSRETAR